MSKKIWTPLLVAVCAALALTSLSALAQSKQGYWTQPGDGAVWKNATGLCWRASYWTPAMAIEECDPDLMPKPMAAPPPPPPPPPPLTPQAKPAPVAQKVPLAADVLFGFEQSCGHTDSFGSDGYNSKLLVRCAVSVKAYFFFNDTATTEIYTEGKGKKQPVASNKTKDGRQKNRRVEIEVIGTRK
jgi:OOP family OmpA-OmpF porin